MSAIEELVTELSRLPTIGRKSAWRLTYHLLKQPTEQSKRLARALETLADRVRRCERCNNLTEDAVCSICADPGGPTGPPAEPLPSYTNRAKFGEPIMSKLRFALIRASRRLLSDST